MNDSEKNDTPKNSRRQFLSRSGRATLGASIGVGIAHETAKAVACNQTGGVLTHDIDRAVYGVSSGTANDTVWIDIKLIIPNTTLSTLKVRCQLKDDTGATVLEETRDVSISNTDPKIVTVTNPVALAVDPEDDIARWKYDAGENAQPHWKFSTCEDRNTSNFKVLSDESVSGLAPPPP